MEKRRVGGGATIGEVARRAGVRPSTLRYYERIGVLPSPERSNGRRRYDGEVLREVLDRLAGHVLLTPTSSAGPSTLRSAMYGEDSTLLCLLVGFGRRLRARPFTTFPTRMLAPL